VKPLVAHPDLNKIENNVEILIFVGAEQIFSEHCIEKLFVPVFVMLD